MDGNINIANIGNLTASWFAQRAVLLQQIATNAVSLSSLKNIRNAQVSLALQNALTYNAGISTSLPYEAAEKFVYDLYLRKLLDLPITQQLYQQALLLSQQDESTMGGATKEAFRYLASWDQESHRNFDNVAQERQQKQTDEFATNDNRLLQIAPNPTKGHFNVYMSHKSGAWLVIYNEQGQEIIKQKVSPDDVKISIDLERYPSGLYWLFLSDQTGKTLDTAKVMLSH